MNEQDNIHFDRISKALEYIGENFKSQPDLDAVAAHVHLSPFHFQKLFTDWVGTSPKKFLQYTTLQYAKSLLQKNSPTLSEIAFETGLSSTSRLHDLFVKIEGMSPAEYKNGAQYLEINYSYSTSPFGTILTAATNKGLCYMAFEDEGYFAYKNLIAIFPKAKFSENSDSFQNNALQFFRDDWSDLKQVKMHLKGTEFQLKVWHALLTIPFGDLSTYGHIAEKIENHKASRAVGTAIGNNPVSFIIPCHRVIQTSGAIGGYMWGPNRKTAIIGWEGVRAKGRG
jgi:AraC family transcriptional regulator of adaptative response/methylated-DNA-[protein]-cysteine methyltransferase